MTSARADLQCRRRPRRRHPVLDRILDQRLQQERRNEAVARCSAGTSMSTCSRSSNLAARSPGTSATNSISSPSVENSDPERLQHAA